MARRVTMRASDTDREHVADRLRAAAAEGRLLTEELEDRLTAALRARTYGDLDVLTADLPREQVARRRSRSLRRIGPAPAAALVLLAPIALALVVAVVAIVFAMLAAWTVLAVIVWAMVSHRRRWYGPRLPRRYPHIDAFRAPGMCGPRRANPRSGLRL